MEIQIFYIHFIMWYFMTTYKTLFIALLPYI